MKPSRLVPLEGGINFRDLGGYFSNDGRTVKWRRIFRCGHLAELTDSDIRAIEYLNITQIHDFRRIKEQDNLPSKYVSANTINDYNLFIGSMDKFWQHIQMADLTDQLAHQLVVDAYTNCHQIIAPHYQKLFQYLLANTNNASLIHCTAGKDRTGLAAALILSALDVSREQIIDDYLLTQMYLDIDKMILTIEDYLKKLNIGYWQRSWLESYSGVHVDFINNFFNTIDSKYDGIENYIQNVIGLSQSDKLKLKTIFLE